MVLSFLAQFKDKILQALFISVFVTVVGTLTNVFITTTYAYAISRSTFKYRKFFTIFALLSMLFNAGLVPGYIVVTQLLHLGDTIWALIVPMLLSPFNIMLMRSFFKKTIPEAILESARIDGASEARIFFQICLPLSLPGIATITLLTALGFWNDWFNALLYIKSDNLYPLQYLLMQIQNNMDYICQVSWYVRTTCSCPTKGNRSYGHGCSCNPTYRDSLSVLPTLLCKRFDHRWC